MAKNTETRIPTIAAEVVNDDLVEFTFSDGRVLSITPSLLSHEIRQAALMHGLKAKLVDAAAISRNPDTGASADIDDKFNAVEEIHVRITRPDGTWNKIRGDGAGSSAGTGLLVRALMTLLKKTEADVRKTLAECSEDEIKALRGTPKIASKMAELKQAKSTVDVDALLGKFGASLV
jgi:hypothetical protein